MINSEDKMKRYFTLSGFVLLIVLVLSASVSATEPLTRTPYKYGLILDSCVLDGKALRKERPGDWGYYITISHEIVFGSDIDSRWLRIVFQYFKKTSDVEFTVYSSSVSRIGEWKEVVTFRRKIDADDMDFKYSSTWPVISFKNDDLQIEFKFYLKKAR